MPTARHPFARHIRNEIAKEMPSLSGSMLDPIAAAMVVTSSIAMMRDRNVMTLNIGDAHSMMSRDKLADLLKPLRKVDRDLADVLLATGSVTCHRRRHRKHMRLSAALWLLIDDLGDAQVRGAFLVEAMDDGHVRVVPVVTELDGADARQRMTGFIHPEDAITSS